MADFDIRSSTIEKGLDLVKGFLERAFGPTIDEYGLMRQDNMKFRRATNQLKVFQKAQEIAAFGNIQIKQMNLKALFPLLEGISLEEDNTLQDMWANLLVNYIDIQKNLTINVYPVILQQLSSNEVKILEYVRLNGKIENGNYDKTKDIEFNDAEIANLTRLGVLEAIESLFPYEGSYDDSNGHYRWNYEFGQTGEYRLSDFGSDFLKACEKSVT